MSLLAESLKKQERTALAQAITLVESTREDHQREAQALLTECLPATGKSIRIGITGVPGVGKSTFIETFGLYAIAQGHKVAVLAIDPSSSKTGGSILGDKTRMARLAQHEKAFIRPTPTAGALGGVARRTREAMLLCEAARYDVIIVETVGVGQSEIEVASMVDMFVLMLLPGSGDELQGIKKGIVELADVIVVNKADGDLKLQAKRVATDYAAALKLLHPASEHWLPRVLTASALHNEGVAEIWQNVLEFQQKMQLHIADQRKEQAVAWMWKEIRETLLARFMQHPNVEKLALEVEKSVKNAILTPINAAQKLIAVYRE